MVFAHSGMVMGTAVAIMAASRWTLPNVSLELTLPSNAPWLFRTSAVIAQLN